MGAYYQITFRTIPAAFKDQGPTVFQALEAGNASFFVHMFNLPGQYLDGMPTFGADRFSVQAWAWTDDSGVITVEVPKVSAYEMVYCLAFAIAYQRKDGSLNLKLYMIEESVGGTRCVCAMEEGRHCNYGDYGEGLQAAVDHIADIKPFDD